MKLGRTLNLSHVEVPSNRTFGFFFAGVFAVAGVLLLRGGAPFPAILCFAAAAALVLVTLLRAELLLPLNTAWAVLGHLLGRIVSPIVLGVIFFGLFTPIGVVMRAAGRDELRLKRGTGGSYWQPRPVDAEGSGTFRYQF